MADQEHDDAVQQLDVQSESLLLRPHPAYHSYPSTFSDRLR